MNGLTATVLLILAAAAAVLAALHHAHPRQEPTMAEPTHSHPVGTGCFIGCPAKGRPSDPPPPPPTSRGSISTPTARRGAWVVYYADRSAFWVYLDELDAMRKGVEASAQVVWLEEGQSL